MSRALLILALASVVRADTLNEVLTRIDQASSKFRALRAGLHEIEHTDVLDDTTTKDGTVKMVKNGKDKFALLAEFTGKDQMTLHLSGHLAEIYYPKANTKEEYDTSKAVKSIDQYLFVGFGTSVAELKKAYSVSLGGAETINGIPTTRLELTPISREAKNFFRKIELWFPDGKAYPMQEKIITSDGYKLFQYSNQQITLTTDPPPPASDFELHTPAGVKVITPGK